MVGNEGEVVTELAHLKSVDNARIWEVFDSVISF
jgi:hypothetical protein